jgi:arylsulfate sulfotransferase
VKKRLILAACAFLVIAAIAAGVVFSGFLVMPTPASLAQDIPVKSYDILDDQYQRERDILADYSKGSYTIQKPYFIQDPYQANPLSALILFETAEPAKITVTVTGKDPYSTFTYTNPDFSRHHEVPVLGLYAGKSNSVTLNVSFQNGGTESSQQNLQTEPLPYDFPTLTVQVSKPDKMEPGVDLMIPCFDTSYTYLLDANGDVRGYFSNRNFGHGTAMRLLQNGRLLVTGDVMKLMPYNMYDLWEMNLLGKVFVEYDVPNGVHHDVVELSNGDFLAASNNKDMPLKYGTREDTVIRIDRSTGAVKDEYSLRQILEDTRSPYNHFDPGVINSPNRDWAHLNAVNLDENEDSIIASLAIQSAVVKFSANTGKIAWILGPHDGWSAKYQPYLLNPVGSNFEWAWGQHAAKVLPDTDGIPNTIDILLLDNGQNRSFTQAAAVSPANNYSRAVIYRIDEAKMTVEQVWEYGKELGSGAYSTFLGNADFLKQTGNINIAFGGMLRKNGVPVDDIIQSVIGEQEIQSRVVEVERSGEPVFDVSISPNHSLTAETYQVRKIDLYTAGVDTLLGASKGVRKGEIQSEAQTSYDLPPVFLQHITLDFKQANTDNGYLVLQGNFQYDHQIYLLGKVLFVLKSTQNQYIFPSNSGLDGIFEARIDLRPLKPGEYAIYTVGGVVDGMDAAGKIKAGFNPTGYKVVVK